MLTDQIAYAPCAFLALPILIIIGWVVMHADWGRELQGWIALGEAIAGLFRRPSHDAGGMPEEYAPPAEKESNPQGLEWLESEPAAASNSAGWTCQVCGEGIETDVVFCVRCHTPHHRDCWKYMGQCSTFGCGSVQCDDVLRER